MKNDLARNKMKFVYLKLINWHEIKWKEMRNEIKVQKNGVYLLRLQWIFRGTWKATCSDFDVFSNTYALSGMLNI